MPDTLLGADGTVLLKHHAANNWTDAINGYSTGGLTNSTTFTIVVQTSLNASIKLAIRGVKNVGSGYDTVELYNSGALATTGGVNYTQVTSAIDVTPYAYYQVVCILNSGSSFTINYSEVSYTSQEFAWKAKKASLHGLSYLSDWCPTGKSALVQAVGPLTGDGNPQGQIRAVRFSAEGALHRFAAQRSPEVLWEEAFVNSLQPNQQNTTFELKGAYGTIPLGVENAKWFHQKEVGRSAGVLFVGKVYADSVTVPVPPPIAVQITHGYNFRVQPGTPNFVMLQHPLNRLAYDRAVVCDNACVSPECNPEHTEMIKKLLEKVGISSSAAQTTKEVIDTAEGIIMTLGKIGMMIAPMLA